MLTAPKKYNRFNRNIACLAALLPGLLFAIPMAYADAPVMHSVGTAAYPSVPPGSAEEVKLLLQNAPKASDYPNAASAFLLDLMDIDVRPNGSVRSVTRVTRKIFNKRGRDEEAEVKIGYNSTYETVKVLRARTIRPDGTIVDVRPEDIRDSHPSDYEDVAVKAFSLPAVDDDCIIDYEYETVQKESLMPGQFWQPWAFQAGFNPVMKTRLSVTIPKSLPLQQRMVNTTVKPKTQEVDGGKATQYIWEDSNLPALETEPLMPPLYRLIPKMTISTVPDWQTLAKWYYRLAKDRLVADDTIKAKVRELTAGKTAPEDKAKALFYYVQQRTRYVSVALGQSAIQPRFASRTLAEQYGDCKDMTTLLVTMLREAGITAYPALLSMDSKDKRSAELPSPGAFDHEICYAEIGGKTYWMDSTAAVCPFGTIPVADRGCESLVLKEGGQGVWNTIPIGNPDEIRSERRVSLTLSPDGAATGTILMTGTGDSDMEFRSLLRDFPENKLRLLMEDYARTIGANPKVSDFKVSDYRDMERPVTITINVSFPTYANQSGDLLIFRARPDQTSGTSSTPFTEDFRRNAIWQAAPALGLSTLELTLPDGYSPIALPKYADIKSAMGHYERKVAQDGKKISVVVRGENFAAEVPPSRYDEIRGYYAAYMKAADEFIVVKKN